MELHSVHLEHQEPKVQAALKAHRELLVVVVLQELLVKTELHLEVLEVVVHQALLVHLAPKVHRELLVKMELLVHREVLDKTEHFLEVVV
jgi:hypothetical protein